MMDLMIKKKSGILMILAASIFLMGAVVAPAIAEEAVKKDLPVETLISLGRPPEGFTLIPDSLKYSADTKSITYVAYNDKKENIVYLNNTPSPRFYAVHPSTPVFSPSQNRHAYIAAAGPGKMFAVIDGKAGPVFDAIDNLIFSPDDLRHAYRAQKGEKQCVVVDHIPGPLYEGIPIHKNLKNMGFSPDSRRFVYVGARDGTCYLVADNIEHKQGLKLITDIMFSPDSAHIYYKGQTEKIGRNDKWCVVVDGEPGPVYDDINTLTCSFDSNHFAYLAMKDKKIMLVFDGKEGELHDGVGTPAFSLDSKRFACAYLDKKKWRVEIDGEMGPDFDHLFQFYFSWDSQRYAYLAAKKDKMYCVVDGQTGPGYKAIAGFVFSWDSKGYAYAAESEKIDARIVVDGKEGKTFRMVGDPHFSPDSKKVVYRGLNFTDKMWHTVIDEVLDPLPFYALKNYYFSADGKRLAYPGMYNRGKSVMVVDGKMHPIVRINGEPFFSPDGKHVAYHVLNMKEEWCIVVDGEILPERYGGFIMGTPMVWDDATHFHTLAMREPGPTFLRVEVEVPENFNTER
jgi:hypothetical protein